MTKKKFLAPTIHSSAAEHISLVAASGESGVDAIYADAEKTQQASRKK